MGKIWTGLMTASLLWAILGGNAPLAAQSVLESGGQAVTLMLRLAGAMALWSGLMEILFRAGDMTRLGRVLRRWLRPFLPGLADEESWNLMGANLAANILGLGNAATPAGIQAAQRLATQGEAGLRGLALLLALNHSCLEVMPTTVITLRAAAGSAQPGSIWGPTLLSSGAATLTALALMAWRGRRRA